MEPRSLQLRSLNGLLYQSRMLDDGECGTLGGMLGGRNRSTRRKPAPLPLCPPQVKHEMTWTRTPAAAVGNRPWHDIYNLKSCVFKWFIQNAAFLHDYPGAQVSNHCPIIRQCY
jgi:hypothetical protein